MADIPIGVVLFDRNGRFAYLNRTCLKSLGRRAEDLIGKTVSAVSPPIMAPETAKEIEKRIKKRLRTGKPILGVDIELVGKGRKPLYASYSASVVRNEKGDILGELVFIRDVTEVKRAQRAVEESETKFRTLFKNANDAIFMADVKTSRILDANKAAEMLLGRSRKEIIGMHQSKLHPPSKFEHYKALFKKDVRAKSRISFDAEVFTKKGKVVPVSISAAVMTIGGRKVIQGIFRDMTEFKRAEEERKKLTRELVTVSGTVTDAVKKMSAMYRKRIEELEKLVAQLSKK